MSKSSGAIRAFESSINSLGASINRGLLVAIGAVTAALGALAVKALWGGLNRVLDVEDARVQMQRMGVAIEDVDKLLTAVDETFQGTPFANPDGFNISSQLFSSGRALEEIPAILSTIADLATHGNVPLDQMGSLFVRIASQGKVTGQELNRLTDMNIPLTQLADALGLSVAELRDMTSEGGLTADAFFDAVQSIEMFEGAAKAAGETTRGAFANVLNALNVLGEKLIGPLFGQNGYAVQALQSIRTALRSLYPAAEQAGEAFAQWLIPAVERLVGWIQDSLVPAFNTLRDTLSNVGDFYRENKEQIDKIVAAVGPAILLVAAFASVWNAVRTAFLLVIRATPVGILIALVSALVYAWQNSETFRDRVTSAWETVREKIATVGEFLGGVVERIQAGWQRLTTWWDENKEPILEAWEGIKTSFSEMADAIGEYWNNIIKPAWDAFRAEVEEAWPAIEAALAAIMESFGAVGNLIAAIMGTAAEDVANSAEGQAGSMQGLAESIEVLAGHIQRFAEGVTATLNALAAAWNILAGVVQIVVGAVTANMELMLAGVEKIVPGFEGAIGRLETAAVGLGIAVRIAAIGVVAELALLPSRIRAVFKGAGEWLRASGRAIVQGLISGMISMVAQAALAAARVASSVRNFFPSSPAKEGPFSGKGWMLFSGQALVEGFAKGIRDQEKVAREAALGIAKSVSGVFDNQALSLSLGSVVGDLTGNFTGFNQPSSQTSTVDNSSQSLVFSGDIVLPNITNESSAEELLSSLKQAVRQGAR